MTAEYVPYGRWRLDSDAADRDRGVVVPVEKLPGLIEGRAALRRALRLLADPSAAGALDDARDAVSAALDLIPLSRPHSACHEYRWRMSDDVCSVRTCARCAPLRAADEGRR